MLHCNKPAENLKLKTLPRYVIVVPSAPMPTPTKPARTGLEILSLRLCLDSRTHACAHSRSRSPARTDYYDVSQTHTTSARMEKYRRKKATLRWLGGKGLRPWVYLSKTVSLKPSRDSKQWSRIVAANSVKPSMRACARALLSVLSKSVRLVDVTLPDLGVATDSPAPSFLLFKSR